MLIATRFEGDGSNHALQGLNPFATGTRSPDDAHSQQFLQQFHIKQKALGFRLIRHIHHKENGQTMWLKHLTAETEVKKIRML